MHKTREIQKPHSKTNHERKLQTSATKRKKSTTSSPRQSRGRTRQINTR